MGKISKMSFYKHSFTVLLFIGAAILFLGKPPTVLSATCSSIPGQWCQDQSCSENSPADCPASGTCTTFPYCCKPCPKPTATPKPPPTATPKPTSTPIPAQFCDTECCDVGNL